MKVPVRPTADQIRAADPSVSAWVGANAGSGKTRVLTQRVARLLLAGARPERILCLTYTKAAAAEMQTRLFDMLGDWAMAPDAALGEALGALEGAGEAVGDAARLAEARRLFAAALETPGGLKIQTIHAFCDALLRRFPLEAGISPRFEVADDREQALMIAAILEEMAAEAEAGEDPAFDRVAARLNEDDIGKLARAVLAERAAFTTGGGEPVEARIAHHLGLEAVEGAEAVATRRLAALDWARLVAHADLLAAVGKVNGARVAEGIETANALRDTDTLRAAAALSAAYLTKGKRRSRRGFPVRDVLDADPGAEALTEAMLDWAEDAQQALSAAGAAALAADLDAFATAFLGRYAAAKGARGLLDFDDLVSRARDLLTRSDLAAWALYKMDGGIDHILVDEAQDTAPAQWDVIGAIAEEFYAGEGAREGVRSLFVVGDEKQSIYSFQGAEPRAFGDTRARLTDWLEASGRVLERPALATSFRSAPGILDFVDKVFAGDNAAGLTVDASAVVHRAHRAGDTARIDLWPLVTPEAGDDDRNWWEPLDRPPPMAPKLRLARMLAAEIARMIAEDRLPARADGPGRRVEPRDILVLVTKRDLLARALIRALKNEGVPVAGADRLDLAAELAVKDLMALVKVAMTPADDLSLAALLRSPVCGLTEEALFDLAAGRKGATLRRCLAAAGARPDAAPEIAAAAALIADMEGRADFLRPYEFLQRVLIHHDARRRLIARLGHEAEDPIDELLEQAMAFERRAVPTLAAFAHWIEAGDIAVKREMDRGAGEVRVMTVHGAKGLEAPVVILPDTMSEAGRGRQGPSLHRVGGPGTNAPPLVFWDRAADVRPGPVEEAREEAAAREADERRRLLYVALTRAEDWLILCGAGKPEEMDGRWYGLIAEGAERLPGWNERPGPGGLDAAMRRHEVAPAVPPAAGADAGMSTAPTPGGPAGAEETGKTGGDAPLAPAARPGWLARAPAEPRPRRITPSGLGDHDGTGGIGLGSEDARRYGTAVHAVLEHLAGQDRGARRDLAPALVAALVPELDEGLRAAAIAEAEAVLDAPFAPEIFGPGSRAEVTVGALFPPASDGARPRLSGRIDRLVVGPERVLVVDFKSDRGAPAGPGEVSPGYLAQLGAYRAALAPVWPDRPIATAILWTAGPSLMTLDAAAVDRAFAAALAMPEAAAEPVEAGRDPA